MHQEAMIKGNKFSRYYLPVFFILLGLILKGIFLGSNSLGGDEPFSVYHSQQSLDQLFAIFKQENNPPLHFLVLHYWIRCFGISEIAVRIPSLLFSALTVLFIYRIGLRFFNLRVAVIAALLFTFSTYQVLYAHEARAYALMGFLTSVSMYYYLEIIHETKRNNWSRCWFLLANALLIYTHFFGFFVLFIQFFFLFFQPALLRKHYRFLVLFVTVMLLVYAPYMWLILTRFSSAAGGTWVTPPSGINALYEMIRAFSNAPVTAVFTLAGSISGLVLLFVQRKQNPNRLATRLVLCWFYLPLLFMFIISFWIPMFLDRYLMFVSIGFYLAVAVSTDFIFRNTRWKLLVPGLICLLFIVTVKPNKTNKREVRETVQLVKQLENDSTLVLVAPVHFSLNFLYYYDRELFRSSDPEYIRQQLSKRSLYCINSLEGIDYQSPKRVVLVDAASNFSAPNNRILSTLTTRLTQTNKHHLEEIFDIYEFQQP